MPARQMKRSIEDELVNVVKTALPSFHDSLRSFQTLNLSTHWLTRPLGRGRGQEGDTRADNLLIMTGCFSNFQNTQAILWFLSPERSLALIQAQQPQIKLQLVGKGAKKLPVPVCQTAGVECIGLVPIVTPYLQRATLAIVPLLHGSGTRIKILEA